MISANSVFCEDIRPEIGGSVTIVGVLPDNIGIPSAGGGVPKIGIYTRIVVPVDDTPRAMLVALRKPDGGEDVLGEFAEDFVRDSCAKARKRGNAIAGFVSTAIISPFPVAEFGRFYSILSVGSSDEIITGSINFELATEPAESASGV